MGWLTERRWWREEGFRLLGTPPLAGGPRAQAADAVGLVEGPGRGGAALFVLVGRRGRRVGVLAGGRAGPRPGRTLVSQ